MPKQTINLGAVANDKTGTKARVAGKMINENFTEVYEATTALSTAVGKRLQSDATGISGAQAVTNIVKLSQASYDALTPNANTLYVVTSPVGKVYLGGILLSGTVEGGEVTPPSGNPVDPAIWNGIDVNIWRGAPITRTRAWDAAVTGQLVVVQPGTTATQVEQLVAAVSPTEPMTLRFAEGQHVFTENILIQRGNITVEGVGMKKSILVADFPLTAVDNLIQIQGTSILANSAGSNNGRWRPEQSTLIGQATEPFAFKDKQITISATTGLAVGNYVMVFKPSVSGGFEFGTLAQVTAISGNTVSLSHPLAFSSSQLLGTESLSAVKLYKTNLLENVTVRNFGVTYNINPDSLTNPFNHPVEDLMITTENNFWPAYAAKDSRNLGDVQYGHHRAVSVGGCHEANVYDIEFTNTGSHAIFFTGHLELAANNIIVNGVMNKGVGGNGYGVEFDKMYWSDITNLDIMGCRHGVSYNIIGACGFNNVHVKNSDSNCDFHGGRDQGNIYLIEHMVSNPKYVVKTSGSTLTKEINYSYGRVQFPLISYRQDVNIAENTVYFKSAKGNEGTTTDGANFYNAQGHKLQTNASQENDRLVAHPSGAVLLGGFGNDTLISGIGNDTLDCGLGPNNASYNSDVVMFYAGSGQDVVRNFGTQDKIKVLRNANGSGFQSGADILAAAVQSGANTVISLGGGNTITMENVTKTSLTSSQFEVFDA